MHKYSEKIFPKPRFFKTSWYAIGETGKINSRWRHLDRCTSRIRDPDASQTTTSRPSSCCPGWSGLLVMNSWLLAWLITRFQLGLRYIIIYIIRSMEQDWIVCSFLWSFSNYWLIGYAFVMLSRALKCSIASINGAQTTRIIWLG